MIRRNVVAHSISRILILLRFGSCFDEQAAQVGKRHFRCWWKTVPKVFSSFSEGKEAGVDG